ncbi:MAG TPA: hypothetical protein VGL53_08585 [Bryobacteraceae bacterium]
MQIQSLPARPDPGFQASPEDGETCCGTRSRRSGEAAELFPEIYHNWGDEQRYSLQLGRGECAA